VNPVESGVLIDEESVAQLSSLGAESVVHHSCVLSRPLEWSTGYFNDRSLASLPNAQRLSYSDYKSCAFTRSSYRYHRTHCLFFQAPMNLSLSLSLSLSHVRLEELLQIPERNTFAILRMLLSNQALLTNSPTQMSAGAQSRRFLSDSLSGGLATRLDCPQTNPKTSFCR
jgi:hypothetical protein